MDGETFFTLLLISFFLFLLSSAFILSFFKQEDKFPNGKSRKEKADEKLRNEIMQKGLSPVITVFFLSILIGIIETITYNICDINVINGTISTKALIFYSIFTLLIMFGLYKKIVSNGYSEIDENFRDKGLSICILLFIYSSSSLHAYFIFHFVNYALDFRQGETQIVTVLETHRISPSKSSKGSHEYTYEITFSPIIRGKNRINVSERLYSWVKPNDRLILIIKEGALGLPYISSDIKLYRIAGYY